MAALAQPVEILLLLAAVANLLDLQNDIASLNTLAQCREECIGVDIAPLMPTSNSGVLIAASPSLLPAAEIALRIPVS